MNTINNKLYKKRNIFYVFLISTFPSTYLYVQNIQEVSLRRVAPPILINLFVTAFLWFICSFIWNEVYKKAIIIFLLLIIIEHYGLIFDFLQNIAIGFDYSLNHLILIPVLISCWVYCAIQISKSKQSYVLVNRTLNFAVSLVFCWNLANIFFFHLPLLCKSYKEQTNLQNEISKTFKSNKNPDIYYIIFDEFASIESMQNLFHYDASKLSEKLQMEGFYFASQSRGLYAFTQFSLASSLNMQRVPKGSDPYQMVRESRVVHFLKRNGYRIIDLSSDSNLRFAEADERYSYSLAHISIFFDKYYYSLFEWSILCYFSEEWAKKRSELSKYFYDETLYFLHTLQAVVKLNSPKFVFVHLVCPHEPFVFDRYGHMQDLNHLYDHSNRKYYLEQYIFMSEQMLKVSKYIIQHSSQPPIIILQADHGYRGELGRGGSKIPPSEILKIFNMLYLPRFPVDDFDPSLSPINTFRLIFNFYFGQHLPLLNIDLG